MKYLGIDYGTKKIGIAVSDDSGKIAFPKIIIQYTKTLVSDIQGLVSEWGIEKIVMGKSVDMDGIDNPLQRQIQKFAETLSLEAGIEVVMEDERMSSLAARGHLYGKGNIANEQWSGKENQKRRDPVDAGAAAIILQRYLDKQGM